MHDVSVEAFAAARADGAFVIDVREPAEHHAGHVPGSVLMPVRQVPARSRELPRSAPVYVVCSSGARSREVTDLLRRFGHDAWSVSGGMAAWEGSGHPVVRGPRSDVA